MKKQTMFAVVGILAVAVLAFFVFRVFQKENEQAPAPIIKSEVKPDVKNTAQTIDEAQALSKIRLRTEVVKYEADLAKAGKKATFEAQDDGEEWIIQVFEIVQNKGEASHTATFGWYRVDKKTGKVIKDI